MRTKPTLTVIIPSRNIENLRVCLQAVRKHEPSANVIVVDDFTPGLDRADAAAIGLDLWRDTVLDGVKPFVFARNCNLGIKAAGEGADVVLLNDDALLESPCGFTAMQAEAHRYHTIGIVSATTNVASNAAQYRQTFSAKVPMRSAGKTPGFRFPSVAFVCVLIPRATLDKVGLLDERFTAYGWEDVDYCRRLYDAKLDIGIYDGCFVDHSKLTSTFRGEPRAPGPIEEGRRIYIEKWGKL